MSLRQILWGLVVILVLGAAWQFLRALRLGRASMTAPQPAPTAPKSVPKPATNSRSEAEPAVTPAGKASEVPGDDAAEVDEDEDGFDYAPQLRPISASPAPLPTGVMPVAPAPEVFQLELELRHLRRELERQQELIALQRAEIVALQSELGGLHLQLADAVVAQPATSPEYSEAMQLAGQGRSAQEIAARCGISVAEAGLVLSLARSGGARS